jgi:hypothetical protein
VTHDGAQVADITGLLERTGWPEAMTILFADQPDLARAERKTIRDRCYTPPPGSPAAGGRPGSPAASRSPAETPAAPATPGGQETEETEHPCRGPPHADSNQPDPITHKIINGLDAASLNHEG